MSLPVHRRYEIVFLSQHRLGPQLSNSAVAKVIKCNVSTVKYWVKRWKQSKDLSDFPRSGRTRATTAKQDQQMFSLVDSDTFITSEDVANRFRKKGVVISERTVQRCLNEA